MTRIERSIHIDEKPDVVFRMLTDLRLIPRWAVVAQDTYVLPERPLTDVGQQFHWRIRVVGRDIETDWVVTEFEPPKVVAYEVTAPRAGRLVMKQRVLDAGDGGSRVELDVEYDMPGGFFAEVIDRAIGERRNQEAVERSLRNLKELVEVIKDYGQP